jgi:hypothetical protein
MGGGTFLPAKLKRETIRIDGERRGLHGDDLVDFIEILKRTDRFQVEAETKRIAAEIKAAADRARMNKG